MMAGGTWTTQNKVRPGAYANVSSNSLNASMSGTRGTVTLPWSSGWGASEVIEITPTSNILNLLGYNLCAPEMLTIREALKRASRLLVFRVNGNTGTQAIASEGGLSVRANHRGSRGNDITVRVIADVDADGYYNVETLIDTTIVDVQRVNDATALQTNDFITFNATSLTPIAGLRLDGGTSGGATTADYVRYFRELETHDFECMALPVEDESIKTLGVAYIHRMRDEEGKKCQLVVAGVKADHEAVINVRNGVILEDGIPVAPHQATAWVAGATAGANVNESNTYAVYEGAEDVTNRLQNTDVIRALENGEFLFVEHNGRIVVEQDINSLTTFTLERNQAFSKNRVMRVLDSISNNVRHMFADNFIGRVTNDENGRNVFRSALIEYINSLQILGAVENFEVDDVQVEAGNDKDSVVAHLNVQPTDAMEKLYMKVEVR